MRMKKCGKCGEVKDFSEFYRHPKGSGGVGSYCKKCMKSYGHDWQAKRPKCQKIDLFRYDDNGKPIQRKCYVCKDYIDLSLMVHCAKMKYGIGSICKQCQKNSQKNHRILKPRRASSMELGHKICSKCHTDKSLEQYTITGGKVKSWCKSCTSRHLQERRRPNGVYMSREEHRNISKQKKIESARIKLAQKPVCAKCGKAVHSRDVCQLCEREEQRIKRSARNRVLSEYRKMKKFRIKCCPDCGASIQSKWGRCAKCAKEHARIEQLKRYANDPVYRERMLQAGRKYRKSHRESERNREHIREYRERGASGRHSAKEWRELLDRTGHRCVKCGTPESEAKLTRDHIVPITLGGTNDISNIQPLCGRCNFSKGNKDTTNYIVCQVKDIPL